MNEVTRIHLGRQPYTISVEAHKELRDYLAAIEDKVGDKEVINEVELRMSELLSERGVSGDKVVLPSDVAYLKQQLGDPEDFSSEDVSGTNSETAESSKTDDKIAKRLFRDTDTAMVAGVSSGLASYFGIDVIIIRLLFVLLTIFGGGVGLVIYVVLWLIVPAAETASEKLQMKGQPVTLEALKESVNRADIPGAAQRVNNKVLPVINKILGIGVKLVGVGLILIGLGIIAGVSITKIYMLLHGGRLFQENLFPVGLREQWLLVLIMISAVISAIFLMLAGIATFKQKWPVRGWITGVLTALLLVSSVVGMALAADAAPQIRERYEASLHTTAVKNIQPFSKVVTAGDIDIAYISSPSYAVDIHYSDNPDLSKIKISVRSNALYIDSTQLDMSKHCTMLCLFPRYNMTVQIYAPNISQFVTPPRTDIFYPPVPKFE